VASPKVFHHRWGILVFYPVRDSHKPLKPFTYKGFMKRLTINSERYPGLGLAVPQVPGAPDGTRGGFTFSAGTPYDVTNETAIAVETAISRFDERVKRHYRLTVVDLNNPEPVAGAVVAPAAAPSKAAPDPEPITLTDEDRELIGIEVGKLKGLTLDKAVPMVERTAMNDDMPVVVRRAYLQAVIDAKTAKTLNEKAAELLEVLAD